MNAERKSIREITREDFIRVMKKLGYLISRVQAIEAFLEFKEDKKSDELNFDNLYKWVENNIYRIQKIGKKQSFLLSNLERIQRSNMSPSKTINQSISGETSPARNLRLNSIKLPSFSSFKNKQKVNKLRK